MSIQNNGGAAFPRPGFTASETESQEGMSLRDWFAGVALSSYECPINEQASYQRTAETCYKYADAMLKARQQ